MLILSPVVELMGNEHTNIYNAEKLNISFKSVAEIFNLVLVETSRKKFEFCKYSPLTQSLPELKFHRTSVARSVFMLSCFSCVRLCATLWAVGCQAPLSMGFSRQEYWIAISFFRGSSQPRDGTSISCIAGRFFTI